MTHSVNDDVRDGADSDAGAHNPKHGAGRAKASMRCVPPSALLWLGHVMEGGADKYGAYNWGASSVALSVYYDAAMRHLFALWTGQTHDPESGSPHAAHVMACMSIILDAWHNGKLVDDRPTGRTAPSDVVAAEIADLKIRPRETIAPYLDPCGVPTDETWTADAAMLRPDAVISTEAAEILRALAASRAGRSPASGQRAAEAETAEEGAE